MVSENNSPPRKCQKVYDDENKEPASLSTKPMIDGTYDSLSDDNEASPSKPTSSTPKQELSRIAEARKYQPNVNKDPKHPKTGTSHPKVSSFKDKCPNHAPLTQYHITIQVNEIPDDGHFLDEISRLNHKAMRHLRETLI